MLTFLKQHLHKLTPALLLLLMLPFLSGATPKSSAVSADCELIILWEDSVSFEESARRIASLCPGLTLTEHSDTLSICQSHAPESLSKQLELLNKDTSVRIAEPNHPISLCYTMSSLKYFDAQWALHNTGDYTYYINNIPVHRTAATDIDINLPEAYESLADSSALRPVTVAIIDTGVDILHPALKDSIWTNPLEIPDNGIDDDRNGYVDDINGWDFYNNDNTVCHYSSTDTGDLNANPEDNDNHGTHCAGIIAAKEGIQGIASGIEIRILPLKIHGGEKNSGSVSDAVKAIKYAQAAGADICNMSWGTPVYSEALENVMRESDMLFVVAAGNSGNNNNSAPLYPASYALDNMISVAYVTQSGELASDSNYGLSTVDIAAPGQDIFSTTVGGEYHYMSGTSMATPVVSGVAALLYAHGDFVYPQNAKEILLQTLKPLEPLIGHIRYPGIPDAAQVVSAVDSLVNDEIPPTIEAETQYHENELRIVLKTEDLGGSGIRTVRYVAGAFQTGYFHNGTQGLHVYDSTLYLNRAGTYTFYISDYAGNESALIYSVQDDLQPPTISAAYAENPDGTFTVTVRAYDTESGIKRLRYAEGSFPESYFLSAGQELLSGRAYSFVATAGTTYTLYAADYRGNKITQSLHITGVPAEQLFLNTMERTLTVGDSFRLVPFILPFTSTDYITYTVSDETVLYAASDGTLTALAPGTAYVTVCTSGGLFKTCLLHIVPLPESPIE